MKKIKLVLAGFLATALLVACGSKETVTVCENTQLEGATNLWTVEFNAKGDKIDSYVWTVGFSELDVEDLSNEEAVKDKLRVLVNAKNVENSEFREIDFEIAEGNYVVKQTYKNLQAATEEQLEEIGLDDNGINLTKRVDQLTANEAITCTAK